MSRRTEQVGQEIRRILGELLLTQVRDPDIGFVTVTGVEVSPDLKHARVFVSVLGTPEEERATLAALRRATGYLRTEVGRRIQTRYTPELHFEMDHSTERAIRISKLIDEVISDGGAGKNPE